MKIQQAVLVDKDVGSKSLCVPNVFRRKSEKFKNTFETKRERKGEEEKPEIKYRNNRSSFVTPFPRLTINPY